MLLIQPSFRHGTLESRFRYEFPRPQIEGGLWVDPSTAFAYTTTLTEVSLDLTDEEDLCLADWPAADNPIECFMVLSKLSDAMNSPVCGLNRHSAPSIL